MIKVALIWPYGYNPVTTLPLSPAYLKSNLGTAAENCDVRIFDCTLHNLRPGSEGLRSFLKTFKPDIVGVTAWATESPYAHEALETAKQMDPSVTTIMGGYHASCYTDKILCRPEVDFVMRGEGERSFPVFLNEHRAACPRYEQVPGLVFRKDDGSIVKNDIEYIGDLDSIAWPDYDAISIEDYFKSGYRNMSHKKRNIPLIATRGCPYRCTFCSAPFSIGKKIRKHSVEYLIEQIKYLYEKRDIRWFNFIDDNFTNDVSFARELCEAILRLNLKGVSFGTPSGVRMKTGNRELWHLMKRVGWKYVIIAPESGSQRMLDRMKKDLKLETVPEVILDIKDAGLGVMGFFMFGYPGEQKEDLRKTLEFIRKNDFDFVSMHNFQPIPGTPVYQELVEQGEIKDGTLPRKYCHGERVYTPKDLEGVNFQWMMIKTHLYFFLHKPAMFFTILRGLNLFHTARSVLQNFVLSIRPSFLRG